ncbi:hypothetical protein KAFR_0A02540 [Kazachstania africana CBS 2517]|uniref:CST complex subunit Stn1 N-terminal domain-containing protein n=1 Tax=Kazachstania africana (strain ATCC 22294 / BCRC 22015 / CBS 2517 / CECT 1963 / NBRC 1671 / NRRL Y-8276) TaxID=1071382 RepID=H2AMU0_KAZAF|nr:hypothetical protein KAFR_0A02540 [Kazachstania africana CBS 2517]CCF55690.1 hypothetical protein KAFR_0A02540 [Kazachstania africana CBS 2517]
MIQTNVVYHDNSENLDYYIDEIFASNQYYNNVPCLLIKHIMENYNRSKFVCSTYYKNRILQFFIKNHPINKFKISGILISYKWKWIRNQDHLIFKIDDNSNFNLIDSINCKISKNSLKSFRLDQLIGINVVIIGTLNLQFNEIDVISMELNHSLIDTINFWKLATINRTNLDQFPWSIDENHNRESILHNLRNDLITQNDMSFTINSFIPIGKNLRSKFISLLITLNLVEISTSQLYRSVQPWDPAQFILILEKLIALKLIQFNNILLLQPLFDLNTYCNTKIRTIINLKCNLLTIDINFIKNNLNLDKSMSHLTIIEIFKINLKLIMKDSPIKKWWIDLKDENLSLIHLEFI